MDSSANANNEDALMFPLRILTFPPSPLVERGGVRQGERARVRW